MSSIYLNAIAAAVNVGVLWAWPDSTLAPFNAGCVALSGLLTITLAIRER